MSGKRFMRLSLPNTATVHHPCSALTYRTGDRTLSLFNIGFIIFPDLTQLDFTGPLQVLSRLPQSTTHIVAKSEAPVPSDCGLGLVPTHTFANCPPLDLLCAPGGS
jgi:transcriptional regulator GlxA family with amidase domain